MLTEITSPLVKVKGKAQITLPATLRRQYGIAEGDWLEASSTSKGILLTPKTLIDRVIEPGLLRGLADVKKGRVVGPFTSAAALKRAMKRPRKG